jgi:hypothetical protein
MLDLDAYLERIGLDGRPSIAQVHRAHLTSIPFENLDPHQGLPISLQLEPAGTSVTPLKREAIPELLATRFSLPGFALGADERLVRATAAP